VCVCVCVCQQQTMAHQGVGGTCINTRTHPYPLEVAATPLTAATHPGGTVR
jgi:hypothetical protein